MRKSTLEKAREYWAYPPCKALGKRHSSEYASMSDDTTRQLVDEELRLRGVNQDAITTRIHVGYWIGMRHVESILDFGCGLGIEGVHMARHYGVRVTFTDIVKSNVELCARYAEIFGIESESVYLDTQEREYAWKFDMIFANGVLHHIPEADAVVKGLSEALKPCGIFVVMLYTIKHYQHSRAKSLKDYAKKSEAHVKGISNPYSTYYREEDVLKLFSGFVLLDKWESHRGMFGWYVLRKPLFS